MKKSIIKLEIVSVLLFMAFVFGFANVKVNATGDYKEVVEVTTLDGKNMYDMAYEILELVNNERKNAGLDPLQMNLQLTEDANYRAAEISLYYSHTRPNGEDFYTAITSTGDYAGENIAAGYTTSQKVMSAWMDSEGHRENILYPDYKSIGIGVYLINGTYYYTQEFTSEISKENFSKEGQENVNYTISVSTNDGILNNVIIEDIPSTLTLLKNEEYQVSRAYITNTEFYNLKTPITLDSIVWESSNSEIVSVDSNGKIQGKKGGAANITASLGEFNKLCTVIVDVPLERIEIEGKNELDASIITSEKYIVKYYPEDTTSPRRINWLVDNPEILTIDENGNVIPIKTGETSIRAITMNGKESSFKINVVKHITGIEVDPIITVYPGDEINLNAKVLPEDTTDDKQLNYQSFNSDVVTVDSNGTIIPKKIGETFVDITTSNGKFKRCKVNVVKRNIKDVNIAKIYPRVYNGNELKPTLSISINNKKLVEDEDYTLEYKNNVEIGNAEVIVTGIGNYEGERTESFEIVNYLRGDVTEDTFINSTDAAMILDLYKNGGATQRNYDIGDMNLDHLLNANDAALILDLFKNGLN